MSLKNRPLAGKPAILAIETSTTLLGVAVALGGEVIWERTLLEPRAHSTKLLPLCAGALAELRIMPEDLSAIGVSAGPGSFTGLRIGFATAKGIAAGARIGVIPVPTFKVLLRQAGGASAVAIVQGKARSQTVTALYIRRTGSAGNPERNPDPLYEYTEALEPAPRGMEEFLSNLTGIVDGPVHVTGDAAGEFIGYFAAEGGNRESGLELIRVDDSARFPTPSVVAILAHRMFEQGRVLPPGKAVPRYYRRSQAEVKALQHVPDIVIDKMTPADLDRVLEIEALSYSAPWSRRAFTSEITENSYAHYYVTRLDGKITGYVGMWVILDEAHITNIAVDPEYRRRRIGQRMLEAMFEKAKGFGATRMTLEVRVSNKEAQHLYKKLGFSDRGLRKGYYTDTNEDAIIMWKEDLGPQRPKEEQVRWMV